MGLKRLLFIVVLAAATSLGVVSDASAGSIADFTPCPKSGVYLVCPVGTTGQSYSIKFRGDEDPICAPGDDKWYARNGTVPPGLSLATNGTLSGTPTQPGTYTFWLHLELPDYFNPEPPPGQGCSSRDNSEEQVSVTIVPGLAKLTVGPESTTPGTRGTPYALQMTASVSEAKTWTINSGSLPTGLVLDANTGLISGTPSATGQFTFEVMAKMNSDSRTDTKVLGIVVRDPLAIVAEEPFTATRRAVGEVSAPFEAMLTASGGTGTYTWSVIGDLPTGLDFADGALSGTPEEAGSYAFTVRVTDSEGRVANYPTRVLVAEELAVSTLVLRPGMVGKLYGASVKTLGGIKPVSWRISRGPLPRGVRFDRLTGKLAGVPKRAGSFRVTFEATDELGVVATKTLRILIAPAPPKPKRTG